MENAELWAQTFVILLYCLLQNSGNPLHGTVFLGPAELVVEVAFPLLPPPRVVNEPVVVVLRVDCVSEALEELELSTVTWPFEVWYVYLVPANEGPKSVVNVLIELE